MNITFRIGIVYDSGSDIYYEEVALGIPPQKQLFFAEKLNAHTPEPVNYEILKSGEIQVTYESTCENEFKAHIEASQIQENILDKIINEFNKENLDKVGIKKVKLIKNSEH